MDAEKLQHRGDSLLLRGTMKGSAYARDCKVETVLMCKVETTAPPGQ